jgi:hypothetical protein
MRYSTVVISVLAAGLSVPAHANDSCPSPVSVADLETVIGEAEASLSKLDVKGFKGLVEGAEAMVPCLNAALPKQDAAALHRLVGIRAVGNRDPVAPRAFAAARWLEPNYRFSKALLPDNNPIRRVYDNAPWQERATEPISRPDTGAVYVDGVAASDRPISWPAVVQWVDGEQSVQFSAYLQPGNPLPEYPEWVAPEVPTRKAPVALVALSIGAGVASGALYGVATMQEARYKGTLNDPVPDSELADLRRSTNTLVVASAVTGTAALGTGVALVVAW